MWLTAMRPDEHWRLSVATDEVVGKPAEKGGKKPGQRNWFIVARTCAYERFSE